MSGIKEKFYKLKNNLNLKRTLELIWSITKGTVIYTMIFILLDSLMFVGSLYAFKELIDIIAMSDDSNKGELVLTYLIIAGVVTLAYIFLRALSGFFTLKQT